MKKGNDLRKDYKGRKLSLRKPRSGKFLNKTLLKCKCLDNVFTNSQGRVRSGSKEVTILGYIGTILMVLII